MQKVILDLLPGGVAPIVYASQYDDGRSIRFMLTEGGPDSQYSLNANDVITCNLTKPDGTETVINVANPGAGKTYVDLVNGADDYDQAGAYLGEIVLTRNARVIGSANFVLKVEEDAYGGQITTLTATGNPCTFTTDLADALVSLTADIVCGGGGGTPDNPIPIVGHSELNLDVNGNTFTVAFGQTVYGGTYDKAGRLTITQAIKTYNGSEAWTATGTNDGTKYRPTLNEDMSAFIMPSDFNVALNCICNMFEGKSAQQTYERVEGISWQPSGSWRIYTPDYDTNDISLWKTFLSNNPLQVVCELATPIEIDVPSISPSAVVGTNNITSDCGGDVDVTYIKKV